MAWTNKLSFLFMILACPSNSQLRMLSFDLNSIHIACKKLLPISAALIAQLVERVTSNDEVAGSTPS